jgi:hypothetical protein
MSLKRFSSLEFGTLLSLRIQVLLISGTIQMLRILLHLIGLHCPIGISQLCFCSCSCSFFFFIYETWYCGCGFHGIIVQAIATGHREMYVCYYEGNTARRVKVGGCSIVLTLYQCKLFSYL